MYLSGLIQISLYLYPSWKVETNKSMDSKKRNAAIFRRIAPVIPENIHESYIVATLHEALLQLHKRAEKQDLTTGGPDVDGWSAMRTESLWDYVPFVFIGMFLGIFNCAIMIMLM
jgi:hypothetical protein